MNLKIKDLKDHLYIIIPVICFCLWALLSLIKDNFVLEASDYPSFYDAGRYIFTEPEKVYSSAIIPRYRYLPSFATLFSIMTLLPYDLGEWVMFFLLLFFSIFSITLLNKILVLKNVERKLNRFFYLIVFSNGLIITQTFDYLQPTFYY